MLEQRIGRCVSPTLTDTVKPDLRGTSSEKIKLFSKASKGNIDVKASKLASASIFFSKALSYGVLCGQEMMHVSDVRA